MLGSADLDAFVSHSYLALVTTTRKDGSPSSSMVGCGRDGDSLLFSAQVDRLRGRTLARYRGRRSVQSTRTSPTLSHQSTAR